MSDYEEAKQIINELRVENARLWERYCESQDELEKLSKEQCYKSSITQSLPIKELQYEKMTTLSIMQRKQRLESTILTCRTEIQKCENELSWRKCENQGSLTTE